MSRDEGDIHELLGIDDRWRERAFPGHRGRRRQRKTTSVAMIWPRRCVKRLRSACRMESRRNSARLPSKKTRNVPSIQARVERQRGDRPKAGTRSASRRAVGQAVCSTSSRDQAGGRRRAQSTAHSPAPATSSASHQLSIHHAHHLVNRDTLTIIDDTQYTSYPQRIEFGQRRQQAWRYTDSAGRWRSRSRSSCAEIDEARHHNASGSRWPWPGSVVP